MRFSKLIVVSVLLLNIVFTVAILWIFVCTGKEPTVLVAGWFAFTTGELWALSGITKEKIKLEGAAMRGEGRAKNDTLPPQS